jgi:hypothetical protein
MLLQDHRVNPSDEAIRLAIKNRHKEIVEILLKGAVHHCFTQEDTERARKLHVM